MEVASSKLRVKIVSIVNEDSNEKGMFLTYFLKKMIFLYLDYCMETIFITSDTDSDYQDSNQVDSSSDIEMESQPTRSSPIECQYCYRQYIDKRELNKHVHQAHSDPKDNVSEEEERDDEPRKKIKRVHLTKYQKGILSNVMEDYLAGNINKRWMMELENQTGLKTVKIKVCTYKSTN